MVYWLTNFRSLIRRRAMSVEILSTAAQLSEQIVQQLLNIPKLANAVRAVRSTDV